MRGLLVLTAIMAGLVAVSAPAGPAQAQLPFGCVPYSDESDDTATRRCKAENAGRDQRAAEMEGRRQENLGLLQELRRRPPLAAAQNRLIGRWQAPPAPRMPTTGAEIFSGGLDSALQGLNCGLMFSGGQVEFSAERWALTDASGRDDLGPVAYKGGPRGMVAVLPAQGAQMMIFEFAGPDRARLQGVGECELRRIAGAPNAGVPNAGSAVRPAPPPAAGRAGPGRPTYDPPALVYESNGRPPDEVCARAFVDELGKARVETVREILKVRYKQTQAGVTPGAQTVRLAARDSLCEDPRIGGVLYDFDTAGILRQVTQVWKRPQGSAIYAEVLAMLSRISTSGPAGSPRAEGATRYARYIIEDRPQQGAVTVSYIPLLR